jgi:hypothetical protein
MAAIPLTWHAVSVMEADLLENGALRKSWSYPADARIKISGALLGVGPVVYKGKTEDPNTGEASYSGVIRDALFLFCDVADCVYAVLENVDPTALQETIDDYIANYGGDIAAMQAMKPVPA